MKRQPKGPNPRSQHFVLGYSQTPLPSMFSEMRQKRCPPILSRTLLDLRWPCVRCRWVGNPDGRVENPGRRIQEFLLDPLITTQVGMREKTLAAAFLSRESLPGAVVVPRIPSGHVETLALFAWDDKRCGRSMCVPS